jgi:hypothetical protein
MCCGTSREVFVLNSNLLQKYSDLLITEDTTTGSAPTFNAGNKVYAASLSATVIELRRLLVSDPADDPSIVSLAAGGLDNDLLKLLVTMVMNFAIGKVHLVKGAFLAITAFDRQ